MMPDAVVVGAGHNGLVAANLLADAGWDVVVVEASAQPGGAVRTAQVAAEGFDADLCSAFYPFGACSPVFEALDLASHGLTWAHAPAVMAHLLPDGRSAVLHRDRERTAASVAQFAAADADRWLAACAEWDHVGPRVLDLVFGSFPPVRAGLRLLRGEGVGGALRLSRRMLASARELGGEMFAGEGARLLLTGCAMHSDVSPEGAGSGAYGWLLTMIGQQYGFPAAQGGAGRITDALLRRLAARGGQVVCGARIDRIIVGGGRALGVRTVDGRSWRARRAVLTDVPAPVLYGQLLCPDDVPVRLLEDVKDFRYDPPTVKIDWALSGPVPWTDPHVRMAGTVHLGGDTAALSRAAARLAGGEIPTDPFVLAGQMSSADPGRSPAGTETVWAYTHLPARLGRAGRDHPEIVECVERIEQLFTEQAPGFTDRVVGRFVQGPADLETENASLVGGAVGAGTAAISQQLFLRPIPGLGRADTPVDRLYLAGASAHPGPGVHGIPGAHAARAALLRATPIAGAAYRRVIDLGHRLIY